MWIRLIILIFAYALSACAPSSEITHETRFMMGTLVEFTIAKSDSDKDIAIAAAANEMQRIESLFTVYGDGKNAVKTFNASPINTHVKLPKEVEALLLQSIQISKQSLGSFDPTLAQLNRLWAFSQDPAPTSPPESNDIQAALSHVTCIKHNNKTWQRSTTQCQLDFGAIAKGLAIDRGIKVLQDHGIHHAIINAGGDMRIIGNKYGQPWRIGLKHPRKDGEMMTTLSLQGDVSIVTSGDYERFYTFKDKRYHHILNPKTGYPANRSQTVTVIAANATLADAWSTALFVWGQNGLKVAAQHDLEVLLIDAQGMLHASPAMQVRLQHSKSTPMLQLSD